MHTQTQLCGCPCTQAPHRSWASRSSDQSASSCTSAPCGMSYQSSACADCESLASGSSSWCSRLEGPSKPPTQSSFQSLSRTRAWSSMAAGLDGTCGCNSWCRSILGACQRCSLRLCRSGIWQSWCPWWKFYRARTLCLSHHPRVVYTTKLGAWCQ